jgi:hypothetical protein
VLEDEWRGTCPRLVVFFFFLVTGPTRKKMREKEASLEKYKKGTGWISRDAFENHQVIPPPAWPARSLHSEAAADAFDPLCCSIALKLFFLRFATLDCM